MRNFIKEYFPKSFNFIDYYLLISLFILLIITTLIPFNNITFTTNDDFKTYMNAIDSPLAGAIGQGRFQFLYQFPLSKFPYIFNHLIIAELIRDLSHVLLLIVVSYSFYRITKSVKTSLLIFTLFFAWLQNSNTHNLITSYILIFHIPLISIFLAFILFEKYSIKPSLKCGFLIFLLTFYGISGYESFIFFLALAPFLNKSLMKKFTSRITIYLPFFVSIILYIMSTFIWKMIFPTHYDGNMLKFSLNDIPMAFKVTFQYTIAALPSYFYFLQKLYKYNFIELLKITSPITFIRSFVTFLLVIFIMFKTEPIIMTKKHKLIILSILLLTLAFAMNSLYGLTSKYREWVTVGTPAYVGTYFSALFFTIFFAIFLNITQTQLKLLPRFIIIPVFALGISLGSLLIGISNQYINIQETDMTSKLQLVNQFLTSDLYNTLNENDIIMGQSLFEGSPGFLTNDWTDYFQYKTGKRINVVKSQDDKKDVIPKRQIDLNIIKVDSDPFDNVLVISEVIPNSNNLEFSDILYLYSNKSGILDIVGTYDHPKDHKDGFKVISNNLQGYSYNQETFSIQVAPNLQNNGYNAGVSTGEPFNVKSIQVIRNLTPINLSICSIVWGKGFYELEQNPEHRWGQKNSVMTIVNSNHSPILVQLSGNYSTGYTEFSSVQIKSNLFSDIVQVNNKGTHWEKTIELPPGNTQIQFETDAKQVDTPIDPRQLFVSISDFTISPVYTIK